MQVYLVANPKGGAGKSTLATNLAGLLAWRGGVTGAAQVMLGDVDRQQSSRLWLARRPAVLPLIRSWDLKPDRAARPPAGTTHVVLDTPAAFHGDKLKECLKLATRVLVPVQPSMFDILATRSFFDELAELKAARGVQVALIGMRVNERSRAAAEFLRFVEGSGLPLVACLRDTQNYVQLAAHGMSLFDVAPTRVARDLEQWQAIAAWLGVHCLPPTLD
ncbi:ParA family protein [Uliginosibacterium aquaticum]|uniref:ParA family protein n=1 Tax=Uliginosibacterium aquaticum TaxID=2731212 RepID=A0ABX2IEN1_9RHOO|nr:ParA family protein [Uliginosibacterium aquaticum]NSL55130.1 ParA family protein [Uliginosibacterium aquaticum]